MNKEELQNEYECVQWQWGNVCHEQEKIALIISDIAKQLNINITFSSAYYHQFESIIKLLKFFNAPRISKECENDLKEIIEDFYE